MYILQPVREMNFTCLSNVQVEIHGLMVKVTYENVQYLLLPHSHCEASMNVQHLLMLHSRYEALMNVQYLLMPHSHYEALMNVRYLLMPHSHYEA